MTARGGGEELIPRLFSGKEEGLVIRGSQAERIPGYQAAGLTLVITLLWAGILLLFRGKGKKGHDVNDKLSARI